ncbi:MAG: hypothetical protein V1857_05775 [archaeon]
MAEYQPGVCNIGPAEIAKRKQVGWVGTGATAILWLTLMVFHISRVWRLTIFIPATVAAIGLLQGYLHFCARFGFRGVFNFGPQVGKTETVEQAEFRRKDRQKASRIVAYSVLIAAILTALSFFSPF